VVEGGFVLKLMGNFTSDKFAGPIDRYSAIEQNGNSILLLVWDQAA